MNRLPILAVALLAVVSLGCGKDNASSQSKPPIDGDSRSIALPPPGKPLVGTKPPMPAAVIVAHPPYRVDTLASGLEVPWDIAFVSRERMYVTERPGRVRLVEKGKLRDKPYAVIRSVAAGEGGLMGIALHPRYPNPPWVYVMYTYSSAGEPHNRISRFTDTGSTLSDEKILLEGIRGAMYHDGGALRFGPDGQLYAGTGDAGRPESAQDRSSLSGKILRMTPGGTVPPDNPFPNSFVYAYGLRNVQGLAWNPANNDLWATMHGPSGEFGLEAMDSVFIVTKGANCGWPRSLGVTNAHGVTPPYLFFPGRSVPPAQCTFYTGSLMPELRGSFFFATLASGHLQRVVLSKPGHATRIERWFETGMHEGKYGRLRAVVQGPDGALYVTTSNRDRRGRVNPGDDRILRIRPK